jgi:hypothetical protein
VAMDVVCKSQRMRRSPQHVTVSFSCDLQVPGDPLGLIRLFSSPQRFCERLQEFMLRGALHPRCLFPAFSSNLFKKRCEYAVGMP